MVHKEVDVSKLDMNDRQMFIDMIFKVAEEDNEKFLRKFRQRIDKVGISLPTVEVRFEHLTVEADCQIGSRALPTLPNVARNLAESAIGMLGINMSKRTKLTILKDASGSLKPSRMTLLLGPPSSGKTTLLLALAGKLDPSLKVSGDITYNGYKLNEFVPRKTSAYISQNDVHVGVMTVKETLDFSARCQGVGTRHDLLSELARREKEAGIFPEAEVDLFMKATAMKGAESNLFTDYTLKGDDCWAHKNLFMDEISTGLDSSTTFQIVKCLQQIVHLTEATVLMSLLQPAPETFDLFDDVILLSEGRIVYQGPRQHILEFFESCGFRCPDRKGTADFLQEVTSKKDQEQYWADKNKPYRYVSVPEFAERFFKHLLLVFLTQQMAAGLFRLIAGVCRTMIIANTGGVLILLLIFLLGGFIIPKGQIPNWWEWAYWASPLSYGYNAYTVNEFYAPRWMNKLVSDNTRLGEAVLESFDVFRNKNWYWIGAGALLGFAVLFNVLFTFALMYLAPPGKKQAIISEESAKEMEREEDSKGQPRLRMSKSNPHSLSSADGNNTREMEIRRMSSRSNPNGLGRNADSSLEAANGVAPKRGMVLPFTPLAMSFNSVNYYVDMPAEMKQQGVPEDRLQLLREVTGAFRPGVLTALMGVSGAGKTTLMDVLAGRKTGGYIEGDIRISGFLKKQETFARVSGYCEQNDIHSPQVTVRESLIYSAFLRLPKEVSKEEKMIFVDEVMELVELDNLKDAIVGLPGVTGLSTEQRKRLTIAVELVANPSIIFMDEPTSGLDARAAAIVMRTVRNTVDTGRTVVCTIHQPSIDIFEAFDELLLMKRGGQVIYSGPLGRNSHKIIEYFEEIPGVPKIKEKYNPATWMLEVSSIAAEVRLGIDFAEHYKSSSLYQRNKALVNELSTPPAGAKTCILPLNILSLHGGSSSHAFGSSGGLTGEVLIITLLDISSPWLLPLWLGLYSGKLALKIQPIISVERTVFYRERAAGMYSALPYALAQVICEIPYVLVQTTYYTLIVYAMVAFEWTAAKFFWFFFISFFSFLYFTYYGMMTVSVTPNLQVASIFAATFYALFNLFSGFFIPRPRIPKWWIWYYWICPVAWTVYGLIVSQYRDAEDPF
ncbi:hypothetical protein GH714_035626 [Hevea brasiliensis]|uniref:ABC transporter domain-containing protein n=1 Tax=Hevea brasiliensis TaxID=3981 RepID=A0A6A6NEF6_HEVBR|nr:hypothetical protein GH714_035626 [Hevea brasiliensis]